MNGSPFRRVVRGIAQLLRFRAAGLEEFPSTPAGFMNSLAPLLAFPILGALILLVRGGLLAAIGNLSISVVALLGPPVLSHFLAQRWRRGAQWLRYATAYNWCQVGAVVASVPIIMVTALVIVFLDLGEQVVPFIVTLSFALFIYLLALNLFLIHKALQLTVLTSVLFLLLVGAGSYALGRLPQLAEKMSGQHGSSAAPVGAGTG